LALFFKRRTCERYTRLRALTEVSDKGMHLRHRDRHVGNRVSSLSFSAAVTHARSESRKRSIRKLAAIALFHFDFLL